MVLDSAPLYGTLVRRPDWININDNNSREIIILMTIDASSIPVDDTHCNAAADGGGGDGCDSK